MNRRAVDDATAWLACLLACLLLSMYVSQASISKGEKHFLQDVRVTADGMLAL